LQGQALAKSPEAQRQREGDTLYIECPYTAGITDQQTKYWCLQRNNRCHVLQTYYEYGKQSEDERIKMDKTTSNTMSITMTDLKVEDSGTYFCAFYPSYNNYVPLKTISLTVFKGEYLYPPKAKPSQEATSFLPLLCPPGNTFTILSVVLLILLLLALLTSTALGVRYYKLLLRTGTWSGDCPSRAFPHCPQPGRRESSQSDSKGPAYINLDVQSQPSPEDPLYCNLEPSQAGRNPQGVEYAVIAFNQSPRSRE
ncbi:TRML4 protein, partial [Chloropsis hardwickii]|nr:TRML4 protein [Chloropsis hardwickii]